MGHKDFRLRFAFPAAILAMLATAQSAEAITVNILGHTIDISVDEALIFEHDWRFKVTHGGGRAITSFHVEGLEGDVTDTDEYNDFLPGNREWDPPTKNAATSGFGWDYLNTGLNGLIVKGQMVTFGFDSDYDRKQMFASGKFRVGLDFGTGPGKTPVRWSRYFRTSEPYGEVPLPIPGIALLGALAMLGFVRKRHFRPC